MIREVKLLEVSCDGCNVPFCLYEEYEVHRFYDERDVDLTLDDHEWSVGGGHYCPTCTCERETGHQLVPVLNQGYKSCDCGKRYERAVTVHDRLERV